MKREKGLVSKQESTIMVKNRSDKSLGSIVLEGDHQHQRMMTRNISKGSLIEVSKVQQDLLKFVNLINTANKKGIKELKEGNEKKAEMFLKDAEAQTDRFKKFWYLNQKELGDLLDCHQAYKCITLTLNNLGLMYKKQNKLSSSARFFKQILEIEEAVKNDISYQLEQEPNNKELEERHSDISRELGSTLINLCSMYSSMGKHEIALKFVQRSNKVLEKLFLGDLKNLSKEQQSSNDFHNFVQIIATSYHNTGVEFEHLKQYEQTMKFYLLAFSLANKYLGSQHPLCNIFQTSFLQVKKKNEEIKVLVNPNKDLE